jgi:hypothetical protein
MANETEKIGHYRWFLLGSFICCGWAICLRSIFFEPVIGPALYLFFVAPVITIFLLFFARRNTRFGVGLVAVFWIVSVALAAHAIGVRSGLRWLSEARSFKSKVLAQPANPDGTFNHTEWDSWGFPGAGSTYVYLVFDPNDSLPTASQAKAKATFSGLPCPVAQVDRLESHWYKVFFYTDTSWGSCH